MKCLRMPEGSIYHGDCLQVMRHLPPDSVDLVFGSPPYEDVRTYGIDFKLKGQDWVDWMVEVFEESLTICKGLVAFVVGHGKGARKWSGVPALLCADLIRKGINLRSPMWYHRSGIMGSGGRDWFRADLEWIICADSGPAPLPWSNNTACGKPPKFDPGGDPSHRTKSGDRVNSTLNESRAWGKHIERVMQEEGITYNEAVEKLGFHSKTGWVRGKNGQKVPKRYNAPEVANPGNVIHCSTGGHRMGSNITHENEAGFPNKLPNFFIRSCCPPGGVVMDPFGGSGTTLDEAIKAGRKFISCDLRKSQCELMIRRARQARSNRGLGL